MLDLAFTDKTYEIKLADGTILNLNRPTQAIQETLINIKSLMDAKGEDAALEAMNVIMNVFTRILNRNTEGMKFEQDKIKEDYDIGVAMIVLQDYFTFWNKEIQEQVSFRQSQ